MQNASAPTSFVEGWALYTEQFGFRLNFTPSTPNGLYTDIYQQLGYWNANMLRSNRLAEDTGLHYFGWSYDYAWQFMASNGFIDSIAQSETRRYISMPGQALGYMLGRLQILSMRTTAQQSLGIAFDPVEFNMVLTKFGGGMLNDLTQLVNTYISVKKNPNADHSNEFGNDLISQLFSPCLPTVGYGKS